MSPGEYARLALASVLSGITKDGVAMIVIAVDVTGNTNIVTNIRDESDIPRLLNAALDAHANPDWKADQSSPAKA